MKYIGTLRYSDLEGGIWTLEEKNTTYHLAVDVSFLSSLKDGDSVELEADDPGMGFGMMEGGTLTVHAIALKS
jgi:hypothetical protein